MLRLVLLLILVSLSSSHLPRPCHFNSMCSCSHGNSSAATVSCVGVPFYKMPDLGQVEAEAAHVDIVDVGLEVIDAVEVEEDLKDRIQTLRFITNKIVSISDQAFANFGGSLRSLDLSQNRLDHLPLSALCVLRSLNWLNLHSNQIASLDPSADWCYLKESLDSLFLGENELEEVPTGVLASLKSLSSLSLDHNLLRSVQMQRLPPSLLELSADRNYLQEVNVDNLKNIKRLSLRDNFLQRLPRYTGQKRRFFEKLDFGENFIYNTESLFNHSLVVRDLNLDFNRIKTLSDNVFQGTDAGRIVLASNNIKSISNASFAGLENYLEYIGLERNLITSFPNALSRLKRLKYVYISSNFITDITETAFSNFSKALKAMSLSGNRLRHIPQAALKNCTNLTYLNLGYNEIMEIMSDDFIGWGHSINTLLLQNNRIIQLGNSTFRNTPRLRELSLSFNRMIDIDSSIFSDLANSLESLEISFGLYKDEFPEEFLLPLTSLTWLALDNNDLRDISGRALSSLKRLQYINLEWNRLTAIPRGLFNGTIHKRLREIRLSYNHINYLESYTFSQLTNIQSIALAGNNIRRIHSEAFTDLPNLYALVLSQNSIHSLDHAAFTNLPHLRKLDLQFNKLQTFSLSVLKNVTLIKPIALNISRNSIKTLVASDPLAPVNIDVLDVSYNKLREIPSKFLNILSNSLARLNLGYNTLTKILSFSFVNFSRLEILHLEHNFIGSVSRKAFTGLDNLQILYLSHNHIKSLQSLQFADCKNLRVIDLSFNNLRTLARDVFQNSKVERLLLSNNEFVVFPSHAIGEVGFTLRHLDLSFNQIDRVDSAMFYEIQFLTNLNLNYNKLNILPDNVFTSLGKILDLDLGRNPLTANYKELLHYIPKVRRLNLANVGLRFVPVLQLPSLTHLNLSGNVLDELAQNSIEGLGNLRSLCLHGNKFTALPSKCWTKLPFLTHLDVSHNPIKCLSGESFLGLQRLDSLNLLGLHALERFDYGSLSPLRVLTSLEVQS